jgi:hypothetical protein
MTQRDEAVEAAAMPVLWSYHMRDDIDALRKAGRYQNGKV